MNRIFWLSILALVSIVEISVFAMDRLSQPLSVPRSIAQGATLRPVLEIAFAIASESHAPKLLEHSVFSGESLLFQTDFFSSQYKYLPRDIEDLMNDISRDVPISRENRSRFLFEYHAHYRRDSKELIQCFVAEAKKKSQLYDQQIHELLSCLDTSQHQFESFQRVRNHDLLIRKHVCLEMVKAYHHNDYPQIFAIHQAYCDMPK